jgi:hypothetical protein
MPAEGSKITDGAVGAIVTKPKPPEANDDRQDDTQDESQQ